MGITWLYRGYMGLGVPIRALFQRFPRLRFPGHRGWKRKSTATLGVSSSRFSVWGLGFRVSGREPSKMAVSLFLPILDSLKQV